MVDFDKNNRTSSSKKNGEIRLNARPVGRGVAIGKVVCLYGRKRQFYRLDLKTSQIESEIKRFRRSVSFSKRQLKKLINNKSTTKSGIFSAHLLMLEDETLINKIEAGIRDNKVNAEWSVKLVTDILIAQYKAIADEHLRNRYIDLEDIADRILTALGGGEKITITIAENSIIVAKDLKPSTLIELAASNPGAIITETGGWTSHTFILAREMNLPAVTGTKNVLRRVQTGDTAIVDGYNGLTILNPSEETRQKYKVAADQFQEVKLSHFDTLSETIKTLDGKEIAIRANVDLPKGYAQAKRYGAKGIGLYRSEFLFNQFKGFPSELEQIKAYRKIAESVGGECVKIRTFDLGVEQLSDERAEKEKNPALGMRGIRLGLTHRKEFATQIRALLQASYNFRIDIVLPMISDFSEILFAKNILKREKEKLRKNGIKFGNPQIGVMIEVPSAVLMIEEIAEEVDFLSLGTNDLVQYFLAVDRDNEAVSDWFRTLHPAVLKAIKIVFKAAENNDIPVIVCGEMAGSPYYTPILIGLGATDLSMNVNSILRVRRIISGIAFEEANEIVNDLKACKTSDEIEQIVRKRFQEKWAHLFTPDILPPTNSGKTK